MKKILSFLLAICMLAATLAACSGENKPADSKKDNKPAAEAAADPVDSIKIEQSNDKYRNYYQVWIGSFYDSDDNGVGDLAGLISKLDYINDGNPNGGDDLGADGIWLSPMMPSSTYHKYNIEDYYNIDPAFGTLEDFDKLLDECHKRGIVVIIDLVLNHSGAGHEFFQKACEELKEGKEDGYARYYNFSKEKDSVYQHPVPGADYYYQGDFWDQMPDWNLSYEGTRKYFEDVSKFWLDKGVDGFRLDAVKYMQDKNTDAVEFLKWFYQMAQQYKPDVYMVGEDWDEAGNVYKMYASGVDSFFNFKFGDTSGEFVSSSHAMVADMVKKLKKYDDHIKEENDKAINANFLTNHDMVRLANILDEDETKMAAALYMFAPGNAFTYYGEELGIESEGTDDEYKRTAMVWDSDNLQDITVNGKARPKDSALGGVKQQLGQKHSLLNAYRKLIKIRQQNPEIARGNITEIVDFNDKKCAGYITEYDGSRVLIIHNADDEAKELTVDMIANPELRGWINADKAEEPDESAPKLNGNALSVPARSSVVLKEKA